MPLMSRRLDEDDEDILPARRSAEREMTLGTGSILAIFFGLVVLLGAFFGFGYKLGSSTSKSAVAAGSADGPAPIVNANAPNFSGFKPSAGSPVTPPAPANGVVVRDGGAPVLTAPARTPRTATAPLPEAQSGPLSGAGAASSSPALALPHGAQPAAASPTATPAASMPATSSGGAFVVQIAAVSHQEDAELLVNALHARGYSVAARSEAGDKLVHIQVGPFATKKDAETMKARLTADGYNAYIK